MKAFEIIEKAHAKALPPTVNTGRVVPERHSQRALKPRTY